MVTTSKNINFDNFDSDGWYFEHDVESFIELFENPYKKESEDFEVDEPEIKVDKNLCNSIDQISEDMKIKEKKKGGKYVYRIIHRDSGTIYDCVSNLRDFCISHFQEYGYKSWKSFRGSISSYYCRNENGKKLRWVVQRNNI